MSLKVLVVDDEQIVLDSAHRHLRHDNYELHKALSAMEGMKLIESESIDVVLTDLMMPEMDGLEFLKVIKEKHPRIPVIMITGYATINTALQSMQLGAFDYVAKPFTKAELRGVVERAAHLVGTGEELKDEEEAEMDPVRESSIIHTKAFKGVGGHTWMMREEDGCVLIGVERTFLSMIGKIQTVDLPGKGDELRQGSVCLQIFTTDLRAHVVWSPLSGEVREVNKTWLNDPDKASHDPYAEGWLLRIMPSNFEGEVKVLGL